MEKKTAELAVSSIGPQLSWLYHLKVQSWSVNSFQRRVKSYGSIPAVQQNTSDILNGIIKLPGKDDNQVHHLYPSQVFKNNYV